MRYVTVYHLEQSEFTIIDQCHSSLSLAHPWPILGPSLAHPWPILGQSLKLFSLPSFSVFLCKTTNVRFHSD